MRRLVRWAARLYPQAWRHRYGSEFEASPPPPPLPPAEITDPRVFRDVPEVYSSLPLRLSGNGGTLFTSIVEGVGIYFPPLPDMGAIDRRRNPIRRVWPGRGLERDITRRVVPKYPAGTHVREVASVFLE